MTRFLLTYDLHITNDLVPSTFRNEVKDYLIINKLYKEKVKLENGKYVSFPETTLFKRQDGYDCKTVYEDLVLAINSVARQHKIAPSLIEKTVAIARIEKNYLYACDDKSSPSYLDKLFS